MKKLILVFVLTIICRHSIAQINQDSSTLATKDSSTITMEDRMRAAMEAQDPDNNISSDNGSISYTILELVFAIIIIMLSIFFYRKWKNKKSLGKVNIVAKTSSKLDHYIDEHKKIFINYRKDDSSGYALAIYHELLKWYDRDSIFKDFNNIDPGEDFEEAIDGALNECNILLVIISENWMEILKQRENRNEKQDFVYLEIATALSKSIYTIPITINGISMPNEVDLPDELKKLTKRQYLNIDQTRFETDTLKLINVIDKRLGIKRNF